MPTNVNVYVTDVTSIYPSDSPFTSVGADDRPYVVLRSRMDAPTREAALACAEAEAIHEATHVCAWTLRPPQRNPLVEREWNWLNEGTAIFMESEIAAGNPGFMRFVMDWVDKPEVSLPDPAAEYQAGMFVRYMAKTFGEKFVWCLWSESTEDQGPIAALDDALKAKGRDLRTLFHDYCMDSYFTCDPDRKSFFPRVHARFGSRLARETWRLTQGAATKEAATDLPHLACHYYRVHPGGCRFRVSLETHSLSLAIAAMGYSRDFPGDGSTREVLTIGSEISTNADQVIITVSNSHARPGPAPEYTLRVTPI